MKNDHKPLSGETDIYFSKRLVSAMKLRSINSAELAEKVFVSRNTISGYRTGYRRPDISQLALISAALSVSTDYLLGLSDVPE